VAQNAFRATAVEKALVGGRLDEKTIAAASQLAAETVEDPLSDIHASGNYRLHLARVHCARALRRAARLSANPFSSRAARRSQQIARGSSPCWWMRMCFGAVFLEFSA